ncbi:MAG: orotidine 5'-phosphate decarboxylase / HUMPS family protein [Candidatus Paceibacterota bacterium]|jgi:bifunctional enzyme Fae/Hps
MIGREPLLNKKLHYLQVALNNNLRDAQNIISSLPPSDRIIIEAGTPLIKQYGAKAIANIRAWANTYITPGTGNPPYVVADLKTMDRAAQEVAIAAEGGANAAIALGHAPIETLNSFIEECESRNMDAMIDMMNVDYPLDVLTKLKKVPPVVILHRGVDEENFNKEKQIPLHEIRRIKSRYDIMISVAGGDTVREVQRSIFNDADIVVIWRSVYQSNGQTADLVKDFLKEIK